MLPIVIVSLEIAGSERAIGQSRPRVRPLALARRRHSSGRPWSELQTIRGGAGRGEAGIFRGTRRGGNYMSAVTTTHAITAWLLSRPYNGHPMRVFRDPPPRG